MVPSDEGFDEIEKAIEDIDERRDTLTRILANEATKKFVSANHELVKANDAMKKALAELASMQKKIEAVTAMLRAVDNFIAAVTPG
jgi:chromosome segregation ATPase